MVAWGAILVLAAAAAPAQQGDPVRGEKVFVKCLACHSLQAGKNKLGPSLAGVMGRVAGTHDGYKYSKAMVDYGRNGVVWEPDTLVPFLERPRQVVTGTKLAFSGLKSLQDRMDVVAYLQQAALGVDKPASSGQ